MGWINAETASFYSAVVIIGFLVSLAASYSKPGVQSFRVSVCSSVVTGFFAFIVVGLLSGRDTDGLSGHIYYLAIAATIGMTGKYQTKILENRLKHLGLLTDEDIPPTED